MAAASTIIDQFEGRAMWPMTDAEAVLFIIAVALLVALVQVAGDGRHATPLVRQRSQERR